MDQAILVDSRVEGGRKLVERLLANRFPVTNAFWFFDREVERWILYVVSPLVDEKGIKESYMVAHPIVRRDPIPNLDPFEITLISPDHRLARALLEADRDEPTPVSGWIRGVYHNNIDIESAYLYPTTPAHVGQPG